MRVVTDTDVIGDELDLGVSKPLTHFVYPARMFALVSESCGCQGYFDSEEDALPVMRMKARNALAAKSKFDFRLYRWDREQLVWFVAVKELEFGTPGKEANVH